MSKNKSLFLLFCGIAIVISCKKIIPQAPPVEEVLEGPIDGLTSEESNRFLNGDIAFGTFYTKETGLGPLFVENSCVSCHTGGGKAHPSSIVTRFGQIDETGNLYLGQGGPQLQNRALPGCSSESIPYGATPTKLIAPIVVGLGYLDYVTDAYILSMSDPLDLDGDGVSGIPNWNEIPSFVSIRQDAITQNGKYICRFGKKASVYDIKQQIVSALNEDLGITSVYNSIDLYTQQESDPEIATQKIVDMNFYLRTLKAPTPRNQDDPEIIKGKNLFNQIQCASCHKPTLNTGYSPIGVLSYKEFHPYTDLLLHDMGSNLDDGYTEGSAKTFEWRTPPLWGLGLAAASQGGNYYLMHDGRARSIEEAILLHGGEAASRRIMYEALSSGDKDALIKFLMSL